MSQSIPNSQREPTKCSKCGIVRNPQKAYLRLLKISSLPFVCKACRESSPPPPMNLGKLGWLL